MGYMGQHLYHQAVHLKVNRRNNDQPHVALPVVVQSFNQAIIPRYRDRSGLQ